MATQRPLLGIKRVIDGLAAALLLIILLPLLLLIAFLIWRVDRGPALFVQKRVGLNGVEFDIYKFRSMRLNKLSVAEMGVIGKDHPMVTPIGNFIRRYKVDELPQLINVLKGDMSLVGPRPTVKEQTDLYTEFQRRRLLMPPGMTGWAQVNGSNELSWDDRIILDVWYVDRWSLGADMLCLLKTISVVLMGEKPNPESLKLARDHARQKGWTE